LTALKTVKAVFPLSIWTVIATKAALQVDNALLVVNISWIVRDYCIFLVAEILLWADILLWKISIICVWIVIFMVNSTLNGVVDVFDVRFVSWFFWISLVIILDDLLQNRFTSVMPVCARLNIMEIRCDFLKNWARIIMN